MPGGNFLNGLPGERDLGVAKLSRRRQIYTPLETEPYKSSLFRIAPGIFISGRYAWINPRLRSRTRLPLPQFQVFLMAACCIYPQLFVIRSPFIYTSCRWKRLE